MDSMVLRDVIRKILGKNREQPSARVPVSLAQAKRMLIQTRGDSRHAALAQFLGHALPDNPTRKQVGQTIGKMESILNTSWEHAQGRIAEFELNHRNTQLYRVARRAHADWKDREMTESIRDAALKALANALNDPRYAEDVRKHIPK